jgi:hypothetical protein
MTLPPSWLAKLLLFIGLTLLVIFAFGVVSWLISSVYVGALELPEAVADEYQRNSAGLLHGFKALLVVTFWWLARRGR